MWKNNSEFELNCEMYETEKNVATSRCTKEPQGEKKEPQQIEKHRRGNGKRLKIVTHGQNVMASKVSKIDHASTLGYCRFRYRAKVQKGTFNCRCYLKPLPL